MGGPLAGGLCRAGQEPDGDPGTADRKAEPSIPDPPYGIYGEIAFSLYPVVRDGDRHLLFEPEELPPWGGTRLRQMGKCKPAL